VADPMTAHSPGPWRWTNELEHREGYSAADTRRLLSDDGHDVLEGCGGAG
jgi:hypothetical protein